MRPILKYTVQRNNLENLICLRSSGKTYDIDSQWSGFFSLLDGINTVEDIASKLGMKSDEVNKILENLDSLYLLSDASLENRSLNNYHLERYSRNLNFLDSYLKMSQDKFEAQKKIIDSSILILGLGGLGSHLLFDLAGLGIGKVVGLDFDKVELSNLNRQILYKESDIGLDKALCAEKMIKEFAPQLNFIPIYKKIEDEKDISEIITSHKINLVILVADRPKMLIQTWANKACVANKTPLITGGLDTQVARFMTFVPNKTGCVECWRSSIAKNDKYSDSLLKEQQINQLRGDSAAFIPFVAILTGIMVAEIAKYITDFDTLRSLGKCLEFNLKDFNIYEREVWEKDPNCQICGEVLKNG